MSVVDIVTGEVIDPQDYQGIWFSASLLSDYEDCPAKAFARITKQKQINPGIALINGTAYHRGMELWLKDRKDPIKIYNDTFRFECEKQGFDLKSSEVEDKRLDGERLVACTWEQFKDERFLSKVDPNLVEAKFKVLRNGRMFVGKLDLLYFKEPKKYNFVDFKTGKTAPRGKFVGDRYHSYELDNDLQFNLYPWAAFHDTDLPTKGIWPEYGVWFHARGIKTGVPINPETGKASRKKSDQAQAKPVYDLRTKPTPESVESLFRDTIDPLCADIEDGRWRRRRSADCAYCSYFDKTKERCGAELPFDGLAERSNEINLIDRADIVRAA